MKDWTGRSSIFGPLRSRWGCWLHIVSVPPPPPTDFVSFVPFVVQLFPTRRNNAGARASALGDEGPAGNQQAAKAATPTNSFGRRKTYVFRYGSSLFIRAHSRKRSEFADIRVRMPSALDPHPTRAPPPHLLKNSFYSFHSRFILSSPTESCPPHNNNAGVRASALGDEGPAGNQQAAKAATPTNSFRLRKTHVFRYTRRHFPENSFYSFHSWFILS